jgi:outer membrane protein insertion porin family
MRHPTTVCRGHRFARRRKLRILLLGCLLAAAPAAGRAEDELHYGFGERRLASIDIRGNRAFSDGTLKDLLPIRQQSWYLPFGAARYRRDQLWLGKDAIQSFYASAGFHEAVVEVSNVDIRSGGDRITISIREGPRTRVGTVELRGCEPLTQEQLLPLLVHPPGSPAPALEREYGSDLYRLRSAYVARGHLLAQVEMSQVKRDSLVDIVYTIRPRPPFTVREVLIEGNERTHEHLIRRELRLRAGSRFDLEEVGRARAKLFATGYFRDVSFETTDLDSTNATCTLRLRVLERRTAFYEIGVGAGQREPLRLSGAWGERNLFGSGRGLTLRSRVWLRVENVLGSDVQRLVFDHQEDLIYQHPHLLGSRYNIALNSFFSKETRGESGIALERLGINAGTTLYTGRSRTIDLGFSNQRIQKLILNEVPQSERADVERIGLNLATTRSVTLWLTHETRDNPLQPQRGTFGQLVLQGAGGPVLRKDNSFLKAVGEYSHLFTLPARSVLGVRGKVGWAEAYWRSADLGPAGVPLEDRFFAGGQSTVRGYRDNSLGPRLTAADTAAVSDVRFLANRPAAGGNALLVLNAELRFPFPVLSRWGIGLALFADGGNVWEDWKRVQLKEFALRSAPESTDPILAFRTSVGVGLHYNTPVGPLRLEYAIPLRRAQLQREQGGPPEVDPQHLWHFSLGYAF